MIKKSYSRFALGRQRLAWLHLSQSKQAACETQAASPDPKPLGPNCLPGAGSPVFAPSPVSESSKVLAVCVLLTSFFFTHVCLSVLLSSLSQGVLLSPFLDLIRAKRQVGHALLMALRQAPNLIPSRKGKEQLVPYCNELGIQHFRVVLV